MSDIAKYTVDGAGPIYEFARACEEMKNAKFIMAEEKMRELLITIATSSALKQIVATAAKGFDFGSAFVASRIKTGKRYSLLPPIRRNDLIAYAVNLLYAFDIGAISLPDFLEEYYFSTNGTNFSFLLFVRSIITPLRDAVLAEASVMEFPVTKRRETASRPTARPAQRVKRTETRKKAERFETVEDIRSETDSQPMDEIVTTEVDEEPVSETEENYQSTEKITVEPPAGENDDDIEEVVEVDVLPDFIEAKIPNDVAMDLITKLGDIYTEASESGQLGDTELSELYSVANALATGITERSAQMIRTLMTGFSGVIRSGSLADRLSPKAEEVDKILRSYGV